MNKKRINDWLLPAKEAIENLQIVNKDGAIEKTYRAHISEFGVAVASGSLPAAVAFFSEQAGASVSRQKLIQAMYYCIYGEIQTPVQILEFVCNKRDDMSLKEQFIDAAISVKLAMNFYNLTKE